MLDKSLTLQTVKCFAYMCVHQELHTDGGFWCECIDMGMHQELQYMWTVCECKDVCICITRPCMCLHDKYSLRR